MESSAGKAEQPRGQGRIPEDELDERVDLTESMLARGFKKSDIKRALVVRYGVTARTCENYISRAREKLILRLNQSVATHRASSLAFYQSILGDRDATAMEKIRAQGQIDKLLGLSVPQRIALTDSEGNDLGSDEARKRLDDIADQVFAEAGGLGEADGGPEEGS